MHERAVLRVWPIDLEPDLQATGRQVAAGADIVAREQVDDGGRDSDHFTDAEAPVRIEGSRA